MKTEKRASSSALHAEGEPVAGVQDRGRAVAIAGSTWSTSGMTSSVRLDWATPRQLYRVLDGEFHFTLDVCATHETATCEEWFGASGLDHPWVPVREGAVWCNPPYGSAIGKWIEKAHRDSLLYHQTVVMLLPARTDTQWFHAYCLRGEIRFLRGRLYFDDGNGRAPFPSMIVIFGKRDEAGVLAPHIHSGNREASTGTLGLPEKGRP